MESTNQAVSVYSEEWEKAPEMDEQEFRKIIESLYFSLQRMPRNADRLLLKDVRISEYARLLNL